MSDLNPVYLGDKELAIRWQMSEAGIKSRIHRGLPMPPIVSLSKKRLYRLDEVAAFEASRTITADGDKVAYRRPDVPAGRRRKAVL